MKLLGETLRQNERGVRWSRSKNEIDILPTEFRTCPVGRLDPPRRTVNSKAIRHPAADSTDKPAQTTVRINQFLQKTPSVTGENLPDTFCLQVCFEALKSINTTPDPWLRGDDGHLPSQSREVFCYIPRSHCANGLDRREGVSEEKEFRSNAPGYAGRIFNFKRSHRYHRYRDSS